MSESVDSTLTQYQVPGEKLSAKFSKIIDWLTLKQHSFFDHLREFEIARSNEVNNPSLTESKESYSGSGLCEAASHVLAHVIKEKFHLSDESVTIARGVYQNPLTKLSSNDGWIRVNIGGVSFIIHPTYGQFNERFERKILIGFQGDEDRLFHLKANPANSVYPEGYEDFADSIKAEEGVNPFVKYCAIYEDLIR